MSLKAARILDEPAIGVVKQISTGPARHVQRISTGGGGSGTRDHNALINREMDGQHPIGAIERLSGELTARPYERLTNSDIEAILEL